MDRGYPFSSFFTAAFIGETFSATSVAITPPAPKILTAKTITPDCKMGGFASFAIIALIKVQRTDSRYFLYTEQEGLYH